MILVYKCKNCRKQNKLSFKFKDRGEFSYNDKSNIVETCSNCNQENSLMANDIKAIENRITKFVYLFALVLGILMGIIVFKFFGIKVDHLRRGLFVYSLVFAIPFIVANIIISSERKAIRRFNNYYV